MTTAVRNRTGARSLVRVALPAAALVLATWLYHGYRFGVWPQPGFLVNVLDYQGRLTNDWYADLPPLHWAFANGLSIVPFGALDEVAFVLWLATLFVLWAAFVSIGGSLGAAPIAVFAAGLVAIPTGLGALGESGVPLDYLYPTATSFALVLAAFAAVLRRRLTVAGVFLGAAVLVHPGLGALGLAVVVPCALLALEDRRRQLIRFALPLVVLGAPALIALATGQLGGSALSPERRFELLAEVRLPHHVLYSSFPLSEYIQTACWLAVLGGALVVLRHAWEARVVALAAGLVVLACALGAAASEAGGPLFAVEAYTARLSPLIVVFGAAAAAATLTRLASPSAAALSLLGVFLLSPLLEDQIALRLGDVNESAVSAVLVGVAIMASLAAGRTALPSRAQPSAIVAPALIAVLLAVAFVSLIVEHDGRVGGRSADTEAFEDAARQADKFTQPGDVVLTPPDQDTFSWVSERPTVVTFGTFRFGKGDAEWVRRIKAVTQDPRVLDPDLGTDASVRSQYIAGAYDRALTRSAVPICRYGARLVLARASTTLPRWLSPVYSNGTYELLGIKDGACQAGH